MVKKIKIYKSFNISSSDQNAIILIGNFDGLHLGHQKLFKQAQKYKKIKGVKLGVVTFDPIPKMFFNKKLKRSTSIQSKVGHHAAFVDKL